LKARINEADDVVDVLLIDAHCVLCNRLAKFLNKRRSKKSQLHIYGIDSEEGMRFIEGFSESIKEADSMYLIRAGQPFIRSAASIRLLLYMRWYYTIWYPLAWLVPLPLRDGVYRLVSKYRHHMSNQ
jgi:predicted DCC family thiol-disulfide oxidoreductase YuxK